MKYIEYAGEKLPLPNGKIWPNLTFLQILNRFLGLKWSSIDFQNGTILISQQLQRNVDGTGGFTFVSPKNGKARKIAPSSFVIDILRQQQKKQVQWQEEAGEIWEDTGLVFTNELGHNLTPRSVYGHFKKLIAQAGYPEARFYDLRHSYAVAAIQSGDDIKTVQENLGHHTAAFTLDVYGTSPTRRGKTAQSVCSASLPT